MDFEVFTYGGGEFLRVTFNAVAAMLGNGDYLTALKAAATIGLLAVLVQAAFKGSAMKRAKRAGLQRNLRAVAQNLAPKPSRP